MKKETTELEVAMNEFRALVAKNPPQYVEMGAEIATLPAGIYLLMAIARHEKEARTNSVQRRGTRGGRTKGGRPSALKTMVVTDWSAVHVNWPGGLNETARALEAYFARLCLDVSTATCKRFVVLQVELGHLIKNANGLYELPRSAPPPSTWIPANPAPAKISSPAPESEAGIPATQPAPAMGNPITEPATEEAAP